MKPPYKNNRQNIDHTISIEISFAFDIGDGGVRLYSKSLHWSLRLQGR
jgi:hypothetical protein